MRACLLILSLGLGVVSGAGGAHAADPLKIRLAWAVVPSELSPILFVKPGIARHVGVTYTVEPIHLAAAPLMITALATGEVDVAPFSYSTIPNAVQNAGLATLDVAQARSARGPRRDHVRSPIAEHEGGADRAQGGPHHGSAAVLRGPRPA